MKEAKTSKSSLEVWQDAIRETPKPRAGEHVLTYSAKWADQEVDKIIDERDLLRERELELVEALRDLVEVSEMAISVGFGLPKYPEGADGPLPRAKALLAKHGR